MSWEGGECSGHPPFILLGAPHPQSGGNSSVSPAAVSERAEPNAAGVRWGLRPPELGFRQFRVCSPSGGVIARSREQKWSGGV